MIFFINAEGTLISMDAFWKERNFIIIRLFLECMNASNENMTHQVAGIDT